VVSNQRVTREISLPAGGEALPASASRSLPNLLLEKPASFLGVSAPASPNAATNDAPPVPTVDDFNRRDPQTSSLRSFRDFDPARRVEDTARSWGQRAINSSAEAWLSNLTDNARARFALNFDRHGRVSGEADVLLPLYDTPRALFFTQLGARSMAVSGGESDGRDRWIGNFGLGHRFFPNATEDDSGNLMLGGNVFLDHDFTRTHNRGGVGVEVQYDWLRLSSNAYFPLSGWKGSYDFDRRLVEERPARGWDARVKAFLPFDRHFAFTGGYTEWKGDHVGVFGHRHLEKDPRVWDYGLEYTPFPLLTASVTQQRTERGQTETRFGISFTFHFDQPLSKQLKLSRDSGTVSGDRYVFPDRENRIVLEYRAKNAYRIEYVGPDGQNLFRFRVLNGFDEIMSGLTVYVRAYAPDAPYLVDDGGSPVRSRSYVTDGRGEFLIALYEPELPPDGKVEVAVRAGNNEQIFPLNGSVAPSPSYAYDLSTLEVDPSGNLSGAVKVTNAYDGSPASGVAVILSYATYGGTGTAEAITIDLGATNVAGEVSLSGNVTALIRQIRFTANNDIPSAATRTVGTLPDVFLTGQSLSTMDWSAAKNYCASHGGRLPSITVDGIIHDGSNPWDGSGASVTVEGFGNFGGSWKYPPSGLPSDDYWTDTELSGYATGLSWYVYNFDGSFVVDGNNQSVDSRVACVP
jgi:hypothetical protein